MSKIQVELQEWMGSDAAIANAAWTSTYNKERREDKYDDPEKVADIVRMCVKSGHSVPLESVIMRFWIRMPVFADRQHMTHRMASHNGLSGRYRTLPSDFFEIPDDVKEILRKADWEGNPLAGAIHRYNVICTDAHESYTKWLGYLKEAETYGRISNEEYKRARELLRALLPTSFMVERTTVMNLVSFANYQRLRNSEHAQPEIREVARQMLCEVKKAGLATVAIEALQSEGWELAKPNFESRI